MLLRVKNKTGLILLIFVAVFLLSRLIWLDRLPVGLNHDEADVILSAKAYWRFGTDISGIPFPQSIFFTKTEAGLSGLPSVILAPFIGPSKLTLLNVRLPYLGVNFLIIAFVTLIIWEITRSRGLTTIVALISLLNPWLYFYSRSPTEAPFALLFSLIGIYLIFKHTGKRIFYSFPFFIMAFFSYFGAKPVVPVLVVFLLLIHHFFVQSTRKMIYISFAGLFLAIVASYLIASIAFPQSTLSLRGDELLLANLDQYAEVVNEQRRASLQFPVKALYYNKATALISLGFSKYLGSISPDYLFFKGDQGVPFGEHGPLYLIDLAFILLGILAVGKLRGKSRILAALAAVLLVVAPIGSSLSQVGNQYIFRAFLHIPAFILLVSLGIDYLLTRLKGRVFAFGVIFLYIFSFANFLTFFFFRYPVKQQENHFLGERVLASYLAWAKQDGKSVTVVASSPRSVFYEYAFFSNYFDRGGELPKGEDDLFVDGEVKVVGDCFLASQEETLVVEQGVDCEAAELKEAVVIQNQKDTGSIFKIYNDSVCNQIELDPWRRYHLVSDYDIEKMNKEAFCNRWINEYEKI